MNAQQDTAKVVGVGVARGYDPDVLERKNAIEETLIAKGIKLAARRRQQGYNESAIMAELVAEGFAGAGLEAAALKQLQKEGLDRIHEAESYNTLTNGGTNYMISALTANPATLYNNANAALGVGDSAAAFALTQTNLQGAVVTTDRIKKAMDATFPTVATNVLTARSTFATGEANFVWNEWAFFNAVADGSGTMLNRAVANLGTKTSAAAWQLLATITQN